MSPKEFNRLMAPMRPRLLGQARRLLPDTDAAEDLVQETLIRLWQRRTELDRHPSVEALALTILRHLHTDHWRHAQREAAHSERMAAQADSSGAADSQADLELIELIVAQLPPLQQQIFRMKELEGYGKKEIMLVTGCTDEGLRQNLSRARRRIREQYLKLMRP